MLDVLKHLRGRTRENVPLADTTWFRVGGAAEVLFKPEDAQDLADFLKAVSVIPAQAGIQPEGDMDSGLRRSDAGVPVTILGAASNTVVRDGGIDGVLIKLGRGFNQLSVIARSDSDEAIHAGSQWIAAPKPLASARNDVILEVGAANLDVNVAQFALQHGLAGLEFLSGIPGAIGGALRMNAGSYGSEIKDVLVQAEVVFPDGEIRHLSNEQMGFSYRHCSLPEGVIFTKAWLRAEKGDAQAIAQRMDAIKASREESQPVRARTGGSTFRNPAGYKAWELIDAAGLRGTIEGGAMVSEKHCNFLINTGSATAADIERLVNRIIRQVQDHSGITLEPEIKFIGKAIR